MSDLIGFLKARLDEDEATAKAAAPSEHHAFRHDSPRILREVEAKRAIIELAELATDRDMMAEQEFAVGGWPTPYVGQRILYCLAAVWSDHPHYCQEWKP